MPRENLRVGATDPFLRGGRSNPLERYRFERAHVLLSEPSSVFGKVLRSVLHGMGFRNFTTLDGVAALRAEFAATTFDLWIANADQPDGQIFDLISDIRHSRVGRDIFVPAVVQSQDATESLVRRTLDAGADLLWRLPTTGGHIQEGIDTLIHRRRPFVVTADYIGPDRRTKPRPEAKQIPLIDVPNPLREAKQAAPKVDYVEVIRQINHQKVEAQAFQVGWLIDRIVPLVQEDPQSKQARDHLERLQFMAKELQHRVVITKYLHQAELCRALVQEARTVLKEPELRRLHILKELVRALRVAFDIVDDDQAHTALMIAQQVRKLPH